MSEAIGVVVALVLAGWFIVKGIPALADMAEDWLRSVDRWMMRQDDE